MRRFRVRAAGDYLAVRSNTVFETLIHKTKKKFADKKAREKADLEARREAQQKKWDNMSPLAQKLCPLEHPSLVK